VRLPLIVLSLAALASAPAFAAENAGDGEFVPGNGVPQPLSGDPGWKAQTAVGAGVVMINSAGGQHTINPEVAVQAMWRQSDLLTYRTRLDFTHRKEGTESIYIENTHSWLSFRPEGTLGTNRTQFVFGLGPSLIFTTTRIHAPDQNVHANSIRLGFEYGVGMRMMMGSLPLSVDFGGQQRQTRHDFRATVSVGLPVIASAKQGDVDGKEAAR
jgi:hypothetical protein